MQTPDWIDGYGRPIPLATMSSSHIRNAMRYIQAGNGHLGPLLRPGCSGFTNGEWILLMATELMRRARTGRE